MKTKFLLIIAVIFTLAMSCSVEEGDQAIYHDGEIFYIPACGCYDKLFAEIRAEQAAYNLEIQNLSQNPTEDCPEKKAAAQLSLEYFTRLESEINNNPDLLESRGCNPIQIDALKTNIGNYKELLEGEILRYEECEW